MQTTTIGWIGLGKMGIPMSGNLMKGGYSVTVYNRTKAKDASLAAQGATIADTPAALAQKVDVIFMMVSDDTAIRELFTGDQGLISAKITGKVVVNMSTVSPAISKEMAALCEQQGNSYLDAPVSGSVRQAEDGQLVIMAGGKKKVFEQVKPILDRLGKLAMLVGDHGAGNTAKLAINTLLGFHAQGLAEAALFAQKNGIELKDLFTLINNSALGNVFGKIKGEAILQNNYSAAFALKHISKDLRLAKEDGLDTPLGKVVYRSFQEAESTHGEEDIIAILKYLGQHQS